MAKRKPETRVRSFGLYTPFERGGKELPKIREFTTEVPARLGVEFGLIVTIRKARGATLRYTIEHPPFRDGDGEIVPPFTGESIVPHSEYDFFLGDTVWEPLADKVGDWTLRLEVDDEIVAEKTFCVFLPEGEAQ